MPQINPISFTAPNTTPGAPPVAPRSRSELLAYMLEKGSPATPDYSSVQSPVEGFAKALTSGLQGYMANKAIKGEEAQKQQRANAIADLLFGPTAEGAPDPRRDQLASLLSSGAVGPDAFGSSIATKLGLGAPPEPTTLGAGETIGTWADGGFKPAYTAPKAAEPIKPYSDVAQVWADWNSGFFPDEASRDAALASVNKPGVSITLPGGQSIPTPPFGQDYLRNPDGSVWVNPETRMPEIITVPGGPQATEAATAAGKTGAQEEQKQRTADVVVDTLDRTIGAIEANPEGTAGWGGAFLKYLPQSQAQSVQERLNTVKANIGFDKLQAMRAASPTGGALGQVSEFENVLLQATYGSLEQSQDPNELLYNLRRIRKLYAVVTGGDPAAAAQSKALADLGKRVDAGQLSPDQAQQMVDGILATVADSDWTTLPDGTRIREVK